MLDRLLFWSLPTLLHGAERVLAFAATYLVHSSLLIGLAAVVTWRALPWRLSSAAHAMAWKVALVGALLTSGAQSAFSLAPLGGTWQLPRPRSTIRTEVAVVVNQAPDMRVAGERRARHRQTTVVTALGRGTAATLLLAGLLVAAAVAGSLVRAVRGRRLAQLLAARVDGRHTIAGIALREVQRRSGFGQRVQLSVADQLATPAALSTREICVPTRMLMEFDPLAQESVLAHELAHIRHRDTVWLDVAAWLQAILPFQPLNRLARRRLQEAAEFAADEWAIAVTRQPVVLARALGAVATWLAPRELQPVAAILHKGGSPLVRRVRRLTMGAPLPLPLTGRAVAVVTGVVAMGALLAFTALAPRLDAGSTATAAFRELLITATARDTPANGESADRAHARRMVRVLLLPAAPTPRGERPAGT